MKSIAFTVNYSIVYLTIYPFSSLIDICVSNFFLFCSATFKILNHGVPLQVRFT